MPSDEYDQNKNRVAVNLCKNAHDNRGFWCSIEDFNDPSKSKNKTPIDYKCNNIENDGQQSPVLSIRSSISSVVVNTDDSDFELDDKIVTKTISPNSLISNNNNNNNNGGKKLLDIDKNAKLINEKIILNENTDVSTAFTTPKSVIGSLLENLTPTPTNEQSLTTTVPRQQFGSIAVNNSSDITFGNKHFYEGPVTIQQFLIKNITKSGKINSGDDCDNTATTATTISKTNTNANNNDKLNKTPASCFNDVMCLRFNNFGKFFILGIICILLLIIALALMIEKNVFVPNLLSNPPCWFNETKLCLVQRTQWNAKPVKLGQYITLDVPVGRVIIAHTVTDMCLNFENCAQQVQVIQDFHIDIMQFADIGYNFLIGGDGRVYEGRGWDRRGAHTKYANDNSFGVAFIGTFINYVPSRFQLVAFEQLLKEAVRLNKLKEDYKIYGAKQFTSTQSPGDALYKLIQTWEHWSNITNNRT